MIPPAAGQVVFRLAMFIIVLAALILIWGRPGTDTAGFVITVTMLVVGLLFVGLIALFARVRLPTRSFPLRRSDGTGTSSTDTNTGSTGNTEGSADSDRTGGENSPNP